MRILLVEDDMEAATYLVKGLTESGHIVEHASDGERGLQMAVSNAYDSMIIDRMLPKRDGLSIIEELRRMGNMVPVLILSALDDVDERVTGLKAGGDDYLTKPYQLSELTARLQALTRRAHTGVQGTVLHVGDLTLDLIKHKVTRSGRNINLQPQTNVIDVQISRLRSKIDKDFDSPLLHTVRGAGYKLQEVTHTAETS